MVGGKRLVTLITVLLCLTLLAGCGSAKKGTVVKQQAGSKTAAGTTQSDSGSAPAQATLLQQISQLAQQGRVINCQFPVENTVIEDVEKQWGKPDQSNYIGAAKGTYVTYLKHNVAFGFNKGEQIFDVRSFDNSVKKITLSQVKAVLGAPANTHHYATQDMLVYPAGSKYQLLFIFPKATQQNPDPALDHYNVFYPRGTVNMMADDPGIKY